MLIWHPQTGLQVGVTKRPPMNKLRNGTFMRTGSGFMPYRWTRIVAHQEFGTTAESLPKALRAMLLIAGEKA